MLYLLNIPAKNKCTVPAVPDSDGSSLGSLGATADPTADPLLVS